MLLGNLLFFLTQYPEEFLQAGDCYRVILSGMHNTVGTGRQENRWEGVLTFYLANKVQTPLRLLRYLALYI